MFDSIYFSSSWEFLGNHPDWKLTFTQDQPTRGPVITEGRIRAVHQDLNIRAYGSNETKTLTKFSVSSLPALLHGQNGMPLSGQEEVDAALEVLDRLLGQIARPLDKTRTFIKVDTSLNLFNLPYRHIDVALQRSKLPGSRQAVVHYVGESLTYRRGFTELQFYDKRLQMVAKGRVPKGQEQHLDPCTRVELRLETKDLDKELGDGQPVTDLQIPPAYECLRRHILSLGLTRIDGVHNLDTYLARVGVESPELLDLYLKSCLKPDYARRKLNEISAMMPLMADNPIDWDVILPVDHPPLEMQNYVPGALFGEHRDLVEEVRTRRGMGTGPHRAFEGT
ncbi:MAG: hypothetical protein O3A92_14150 [Verrucomicrobia bacterium]|nr:hypothetical protein [Verrucomicrobiota bacterium]